MQVTRRWMVVGLLLSALGGGCGSGERSGGSATETPRASRQEAARELPPPPPPPMTAQDTARVLARIAARRDSLRVAFQRARVLSAREVAELRQDRNAEQVASARSLGTRVAGEADMERLRRQGRLVALRDSTEHWVLREMEHSVPYVTPDAHAMLEEIGRRFHARLDSLGLPRFRIKVTSALRTDDTQADLRRTNSYAASTVSAHEFGTTVDVSHERFAAPAGPLPHTPVPDQEWGLEVEMLDELGKEQARLLQAELGRAIAELRDQGALHVMMENRQPVYHMTVARRRVASSR